MTAANELLIAAASGRTPWKGSVRTIARDNITLSGEQTVSSVALIDGDRCAVTGQTAGRENGLYVVKVGAWLRASDFSEGRYASAGSTFTVTEGDYANTDWRLTAPTTKPTLGRDSLTFSPTVIVRTTRVDVASYGRGDGDGAGGGTDRASAINAAFAAATALAVSKGGADVVFERGSIYRVDSTLTLGGSKVHHDFDGATLDFTNVPNGNLPMTLAGVVTAPTGSYVNLSADADAGDTSLTFADGSHGFTAGMDLYITSSAAFRGLNISNGKQGELARVLSVSGATVYLDAPLHDSYAVSDTAQVVNAALYEDVQLLRGRFIRAPQSAALAYGPWFSLTKRLRIEECETDYLTESAIRLFFARDAVIRNNTIANTWYTGTGTSYGIQAANAVQNILVEGNNIRRFRHGIDLGTNGNGGFPRHFKFLGNHLDKSITTDLAGCISTHISEHGVISNNTVITDGGHDAITADTYHCVIEGNECYGAGIAVASRPDAERATGADTAMHNRIANNIVRMPPGAASTTHGIRSRGDHVDIVGNNVYVPVDAGGTSQPAVLIQSQIANQYVSDCSVIGNRITGGYRAGLLAQGVRRLRIDQNAFISPGSTTSGTGAGVEFADNGTATCTGVEYHSNRVDDPAGVTSHGVLFSAGMTSADICESNNGFALTKGGAVEFSTSTGAGYVPFESARFLCRDRYQLPGGAYFSGSGTNVLHLDHASTSGWISVRVGGTEHGTIQYTGSVLQYFTNRGFDFYTTSANGIQLRSAGASGKLDIDINGTEKLAINATGFGFNGATPVAKPTVTGSRGGNAALASLLTALDTLGLLTDSSS